MSTLLFLGMILLLVGLWIMAIVDIIRSRFKQPNNQLLFIILVIVLPFLGTLIYFMIGSQYKS